MSEPVESPPGAQGIQAFDLAGTLQQHDRLIELQAKYASPLRLGLSPAEQAAHQARTDQANRQREREAEASHLVASEDWVATRARLDGNRVAVAILGIHQPQCGYRVAECSECCESDGYEDVAAVEWPCGTYTAIKGVSDG